MLQSNYESLLLIKTEATGDEVSMIERNLEEILSEIGGKLTVFDKWGKYLLAYPVAKNSYGVYVLVRYKVNKNDTTLANNKINLFFKIKCNEIVLRHIIVSISENQKTIYQKPEFIVDKAKSGFDSTQEKKIERLLDSVESTTKESLPDSKEKEQVDAKEENNSTSTTQED